MFLLRTSFIVFIDQYIRVWYWQHLLDVFISIWLGISTLSSCGNPQTLPELPPGDEHRLQRAALNLQQKLILREWLKENRLQSYYSKYYSPSASKLPEIKCMNNFQINCDWSHIVRRCLLAWRLSCKPNFGKRLFSMESRPTEASNIESSTRHTQGRVVVDSCKNVEPQRRVDIWRNVGGVCVCRRFGDTGWDSIIYHACQRISHY